LEKDLGTPRQSHHTVGDDDGHDRAVAMARERGAAVIAVCESATVRITTKADGVSLHLRRPGHRDGRCLHQAFTPDRGSRILALYLALTLKTLSNGGSAMELRRLEQTPALMQKVLERKEEIRLAGRRRRNKKDYLAVVGSAAEQGGRR